MDWPYFEHCPQWEILDLPLLYITLSGCQPKTFKTFILMVKLLKPLFFSEKPLKTFI